MAGGHHPQTVKFDPAIERWAKMKDEQYTHFRLTPRTAWLSFFWGLAVPVGLGIWWASHDEKWDFAGKRHGESLLKHPNRAEILAQKGSSEKVEKE